MHPQTPNTEDTERQRLAEEIAMLLALGGWSKSAYGRSAPDVDPEEGREDDPHVSVTGLSRGIE